jgi:hypothetical protein
MSSKIKVSKTITPSEENTDIPKNVTKKTKSTKTKDVVDQDTKPVSMKDVVEKKTKKAPTKEVVEKETQTTETATEKFSKKKDPNAPKKNLTGYIYFTLDVMPTVKKDNPDKVQKELMSIIGERWGKLSSEDKKPYHDQAAKDKERYLEEMKNYTPVGKKDEKEKITKARTGYNYFSQEMIPKLGKKEGQNNMVLVASEWKVLGDEQKEKYFELAKADKIRYENEKKELKL